MRRSGITEGKAWSKGRKLARDNIKALKEEFEASEELIALAEFNWKDL